MYKANRTWRLTRRQAVGGLAAAASLGLSRCAGTPKPPEVDISAAIDAHCHVFTGKDVPAAEFVLRVVAREEGFEEFDEIAAFAVSILDNFSPDVEDELAHLGGRALARARGRARFRDQVNASLVDLNNAAQKSPTTDFETSPTLLKLRRSGFQLRPEKLQLAGHYINAEARALATLRQHYGDARNAAPSDADIARKIGAPLTPETTADLNTLTNSIVSDAQSASAGKGASVLGSYLALIAAFLSYRSENVRALDASFGLAHGNQCRLYCPALVDYDCWLGATVDPSHPIDPSHTISASQPLSGQAKVMELVSRKSDPGVLVAGYMAYDPLRAVFEKIRRGDDGDRSVLNVVVDAVEHRGFIGAKLYPPMGFKPWNNKITTDAAGYPDVVKEQLRALGVNPDSFGLGSHLDAALDELYQYCLANDVPILAHCGNSQTAFPGSGVRADPRFWRELLDRSATHARLRVNLGHFGSLWCAGEDISGNSDESLRCRVSMDEASAGQPPGPDAWPTTIMALISASDAFGNPRYPNIACDVSDVGALDDPAWLASIVALLKRDPATNTPLARQRILYGTDWMFLIRSANYQKFASNVFQQFAAQMDIDPVDLLLRNARRFLGLVPGGTTASRLRDFYRTDVQRLALLDRLIAT